ncbi:MAG: phosphatidylglycerophosphatase A [Alphaproteobacteria bacterium]|nr:phosphatidylglycerophosphatase A [Alphaproteobacteria bacterium]
MAEPSADKPRNAHPDSAAAWVAAAGGAGFLPGAPGTWGSVLAALLAWPVASAWGGWALLAGAALACVAGLLAIPPLLGEREHDHKDPGWIVIDEVAGQWLALAALPAVTLSGWFLGVLAFRIFDVLKPWPVCWADRTIPGAAGVMADDILAGGLAAAALFLLHLVLPGALAW